MKTKYLFSYILLSVITFAFSACDSFDNAIDTKTVETIEIKIDVASLVPNIQTLDGLQVKLEDVKFGVTYTTSVVDGKADVQGVAPGIYKIDVWGNARDESNDVYMLSGNKLNYPLLNKSESLSINVDGLRESILIFKEIYYTGSKTALNTNYFRDQFYEIYNNSEDQTVYLDGIYFANLTPSSATTKLPLWPESDGEKYVYAERVWKFPGSGTDYPLAPGESFVVAQYAANHQLPQYNPASPVDCSSAEFEFYMGSTTYTDQPAVNMLHVFYNNSALIGSVPQYLTSVFGGAYVMFKPLNGEQYDPVNTEELKTPDLNSTSSKPPIYAKISRTYVIDAVEAVDNESKLSAKRMPASLDKGATYVGAIYNSLGVARKKVGDHADGTPILQDTNDSSDDFDRGVVPQFRRYNSKKPSWSQSY